MSSLCVRSLNMRFFLYLILFWLPIELSAQHPFLSRFSATPVDDGIFLEWTISAGNTCNGTIVERALEDDEDFIVIEDIEGICGSVTKPEHFSFLDSSPSPGILNRYRLLLGQSGYSQEVLLVYYEIPESGYQIIYRSSSEQLSIRSDISSAGDKEVYLVDAQGKVVDQFSMNGSMVDRSLSSLDSGVFVISIREEGKAIFEQKFIKPE